MLFPYCDVILCVRKQKKIKPIYSKFRRLFTLFMLVYIRFLSLYLPHCTGRRV